MSILLIVLILFFLYFLPAILSAYYSTGNHVAVLLINLFLGWTGIGWIVALILAIKSLSGREILKSFIFTIFLIVSGVTITAIEIVSVNKQVIQNDK